MNSKGWGALYGLCFAVAVGWGMTGVVEGGCERVYSSRGAACQAPDGYGWYTVVAVIALLSLPLLGWTVIRTDDWRPSSGFSAGAAIALGITLSTGATRGFLILAAIEVVLAVGVPVTLWRVGRAKAGGAKAGKSFEDKGLDAHSD
ncbi:hypothetical protein [Streptomyces sp. CdTB01]|uniref:hypothetical protein n=1 Tax=Streptomyces sp. CdTB01 TaxID=1725411 RepID=UPI00073A9B27|nr:hypothetical protein [Streptomyces sp. CdTB01]ALV37891.1 hypothetical protein AS200_41910 [Streptomyces sp. CdTB01]